jgi:beta-phosphoglucomutase
VSINLNPFTLFILKSVDHDNVFTGVWFKRSSAGESKLTYLAYSYITSSAMNSANRKNNHLKAVLFDMDGVLVDSMNYHLKSWIEVLDFFSIKVSDQFIFEHEGAMAPDIIRDLFKKHGLHLEDTDITNIYQTQNSLFQEKYLTRVDLYPDTIPLLNQLKAKGVLLGLVTSSRKNLIQKIWKEEALTLFTTIVSADDIERFKPFPDPYLKALSEIEQESSNCLVVENAPAGIQAACSAGIPCLAIASTLSKEKLSAARQIFSDLKSVSHYFSNLLA